VLSSSLDRELVLLALPFLDSQMLCQDMKKSYFLWNMHQYSYEACFVRSMKRLETSLPVFERHLGSELQGVFVRREQDDTLAL